MRSAPHDPASTARAGQGIIVGRRDLGRLRELVERRAGTAEHGAAARLDAELRRAIVVPQSDVPPDVVALGSRVAFEGAQSARCVEVVLALPEEADPASGRLSVLSPVGLALLGATAWETVACERSDGGVDEVRVVSVARGAGDA